MARPLWMFALTVAALGVLEVRRPYSSAGQTGESEGPAWNMRASGDDIHGEPGPAGRVCDLTERGRTRVQRADGAYLYVEPHFLDIADEAVTLVGQPTYSWRVDEENRGTLLDERAFFGVTIVGDSVALLPMPSVDTEIEWVRGIRADRDSFVFVFETAGGELHAGDLVSGAWSNLRRLGEPPSSVVMPLSNGSRLLADLTAGDVRIALPFMDASGERGVLFHRRADGVWSMTSLMPMNVLTVDVRARATGGEDLVVRGSDPRQGGSGEPIQIHNADGSAPELLAETPDDASVRDLGWSGGSLPTQVGWRVAGSETSAAWIADLGRSAAPVVIDSGAVRLFPVLGEGRSEPVWLTHSASQEGGQLLLATRLGARGPDGGAVPYPFVGPLIAVHRPDGSFLAAGPEAHFDPVAPHVRSLLIDYSLSCS